ncbi:MAG TPA: hypothetical protein ENK67_00145 [Flavobacteriia bacterium]|nr:hypothetical protein [Flavobacteriia bacterium]
MKQIKILVLVLITFISCKDYGNKLTFNGTEVYYKDGITKEQANQLGNFLIKEGFATGDTKSVQFVIDDKTKNLTFRMVVNEDVASNSENDYVFTSFSRQLSKEFGKSIDFQLTDNTFKTLKTFLNKDIPNLIEAKKTQIFYTNKVNKEETQKLADYLIKSKFADDKNIKTIEFDKENNNYLFRMVVYKGAEKNEANITLLGQFAKELSKNVFENKPVILHMCDDQLNTIKIIK